MSDQFDQHTLDYLLSRLADESATPEDIAALEQMLLDDAAARRRYVHYLDLHEELRLRANEGGLSSPHSPVLGFLGDIGRQGWGFVSGHSVKFSALAALVFVAVIAAVAVRNMDLGRKNQAGKSQIADQKPEISNPKSANSSSLPLAEKGPSDAPGRTHIPPADAAGLRRITPPKAMEFPQGLVAIVTGDYNAAWNRACGAVKLGGGLKVGQELRLDAGLAELTFKLGARVIVEGPAHFRATSIDGIEMLDGNVTVRADTEAARGFVVKSAVAKVTDLGTEFGAAVEEDRQTDLHVFQGMVEVLRNFDAKLEPFRLTAGQRVVMRRSGKMEIPSLGAEDQRFIRSLENADAAFRRWQRWSEAIRNDPDLVGYYSFEQGAGSGEKGEREKGAKILPSPSTVLSGGRGAGGEGSVKWDKPSHADLAANRPHPWVQGRDWLPVDEEGISAIPSVVGAEPPRRASFMAHRGPKAAGLPSMPCDFPDLEIACISKCRASSSR